MNKKDPNPIDAFVGSRVRMRRLMIGLSRKSSPTGSASPFSKSRNMKKGTNRIGASRCRRSPTYSVFIRAFSSSRTRAAPKRASPLQMFTNPRRFQSFVASKEGIALNRPS